MRKINVKVYRNGGETVSVSPDLAAVIVPGHFEDGPVTEIGESKVNGGVATFVSKVITLEFRQGRVVNRCEPGQDA